MLFIGFIEAETDRAILFQDHYWMKADWLPKKQIDLLRSDTTYEIRIIASSWICQKKGIQEFKFRTKEEIEDGQRDRN